MVSSELVTTAAVIRLIASIGSSEGETTTSALIRSLPRTRRVVVPMPSMLTPSCSRKKHKS